MRILWVFLILGLKGKGLVEKKYGVSIILILLRTGERQVKLLRSFRHDNARSRVSRSDVDSIDASQGCG